MNTVTAVTIEIDVAKLRSYTDAHLATLWHVAQANPADGFATKEPGELVERIGREIIRRFLSGTAPEGVEPELWHHQGHHYYWNQLRELGHWTSEGAFVPHDVKLVSA